MDRQPPPPPPAPGARTGSSPDDVATGQRMLILAILANVGILVLRGALGDNWAVIAPIGILAAVVAIFALLRLAHALGYSSGTKVLMVVLAFVPIASLVMLAMVNARATKELRAAGYEVGFFGARPTR